MNNINKKFKVILSIILILIICISQFSFLSFADEEQSIEDNQEILNENKKIDIIENNNEVINLTNENDNFVEEKNIEQKENAPEIVKQEEEQEEIKKVEQEEKIEEPIISENIEKKEEDPPIAKAAVKAVQEEPEVEYPFTVTYHFYYKDVNDNWVDASWSQSVTSAKFSASKKVSYFNKYPPKTVTTDSVIYTFEGTWTGDLGTVDASDKVSITGTMFTEATDIEFYADYSEEDIVIPVAIVHIRYLDFDGEWTEDIIENEIAPGIGWTIQEGAFDDNIDWYREIEVDNIRYSFVGWDKKLPLTIKNIKEDTHYYFTAQYEIQEVINLTMNYIDNVSNGGGSWSNNGSIVFYEHEFDEPADIPEGYTFMYWQGEDEYYYAGETLFVYADDFEEDTVLNFVATYSYEPQATVIIMMKAK